MLGGDLLNVKTLLLGENSQMFSMMHLKQVPLDYK